MGTAVLVLTVYGCVFAAGWWSRGLWSNRRWRFRSPLHRPPRPGRSDSDG